MRHDTHHEGSHVGELCLFLEVGEEVPYLEGVGVLDVEDGKAKQSEGALEAGGVYVGATPGGQGYLWYENKKNIRK